MQFVDHEYIYIRFAYVDFCYLFSVKFNILWAPDSVSCWIREPEGEEIATENPYSVTV